jgi:F-type H+-transporting ATPase subunit delta
VHDVALHTALLLIRKRREAVMAMLPSEYHKLQMAARGSEPLVVTSARRLSDAELNELVGRLERLYSRRFEVRQVVDSGVIGGVRISMGDRRIDGTISGQLDALARTLFATN